uniref:Ig-like domain-containing protein n=1 Tax=Stegastes partitus TaxID=144197 RepID=A0A3B5BB55_9TELE
LMWQKSMFHIWLHDGKPLAAANRLRMVNEFGYCSLDYEVAYARDSGVITCRATNKYGVDQTSATLIVKDEKGLVEETQLPEGRKGAHRIDEMERMAHEGGPYGVTAEEETEKMKPEIVLLPEPVSVLEGETARFRCRVTGYPAPKVNWYLNGQLIRKSKRYRLRYDGIYYLEIIEIKSYDAGESMIISLDVLPTFEVTEMPPRFINPICDMETPEGTTIMFECSLMGIPSPIVSWFKGDKKIPHNNKKYVHSSDGDNHFLKICKVGTQDSGVYTCRAINVVGETLCRACLVVLNAKAFSGSSCLSVSFGFIYQSAHLKTTTAKRCLCCSWTCWVPLYISAVFRNQTGTFF